MDKDADLYQLLGSHPSSSAEQLCAEYKIRALQLHPDKNPENPEAEAQFARLQRAKEILCDVTTRDLYDRWRAADLGMSFQQWLDKRDAIAMPSRLETMHWRAPEKPQAALAAEEGPLPTQTPPAQPQASVIHQFRNYQI